MDGWMVLLLPGDKIWFTVFYNKVQLLQSFVVLLIKLGVYTRINFFSLLSETYTSNLSELLGLTEVIQVQPIYTCTVVQLKIWSIYTHTLWVTC